MGVSYVSGIPQGETNVSHHEMRGQHIMATIEVSDAVKNRIDVIVADAKAREERDGEPNGMTDHTGALDWALDMAKEAAPEMPAF